MKNSSKILEEISFIQVLGILFVVLGHSEPDKSRPEFYSYIYDVIYLFHMPLFMTISGFLFALFYNEKEYFSFIKNKAIRLLLPYIFLNILALIPKACFLEYNVKKISFSLDDILLNFLYPWSNAITYLWFLPTLFIIFVFAPLLNIKNKSWVRYLFLSLLFILIHIYNPASDIFFMNISGVLNYLVFFWFGMIFAYNNEKIEKLFLMEKFLGANVFLFILLVYVNFSYCDKPMIKMITAILGTNISFSLSYNLVKRNCAVFKYFYGYSYQIYLLSWFSQGFIKILMVKFLHMSFYPTAIGMVVFGMYIPVIISKKVMKYNIKIGKLIGL